MAQFRGKKIIFSPQFHRRSLILHFRGQNNFKLSKDVLSTISDKVSYSYDKSTWTEWDGEEQLSSINKSIYILCE